jgi:hypothetical protein
MAPAAVARKTEEVYSDSALSAGYLSADSVTRGLKKNVK